MPLTRDLNDNSPILRYHCETALEFLQCLDATSAVFRGDAWLYRGVSDVRYKLLPSVLRETAAESIAAILGRDSYSHAYEQRGNLNVFHVMREVELVIRFSREADATGLRVPGMDADVNSHLFAIRKKAMRVLKGLQEDGERFRHVVLGGQETNWPTPACQHLLALARHSGFPTRLLDWSYSSFVAAYFACAFAADADAVLDGRVCVWALSGQAMLTAAQEGLWSLPQILRTPLDGNKNLAAQKGMFTASRIAEANWLDVAETRPIDEIVTAAADELDEGKKLLLRHGMIAVTMDARHAPGVLRFLQRMGIRLTTLFPSYASVLPGIVEDWALRDVEPIDLPKNQTAENAGQWMD